MKLLIVLGKTLFFYIMISCLYRFMGKREIGELKIVDLVVSMFIANLVAVGIEKYEDNILLTVLPVLLLVFLQILVSRLSMKYTRVRKIVDGDPSIIINRGKINFKEMLQQRYNLDDLLMELRGKGIKSIEEVDYAILEVSGRLSVFNKKDNGEYPLPLILNGQIDEDVLIQIGKDHEWLMQVLDEEGYKLEDVFYGFYQKNNLFLIKSENIK